MTVSSIPAGTAPRPNQARRESTIDGFMLATLVVVVVDLVFGGATQPDAVSTMVARLVNLPLLVASLWRLRGVRLGWGGKSGLGLLAAIVAVPLLQAIPLPPSVWEALPGRASVVADYAAAGVAAPWAPLSLAPYETQDVLLWLVPPCALFLAGLCLGRRAALAVCLVIPVVGVIAVALGLMQVLARTGQRLAVLCLHQRRFRRRLLRQPQPRGGLSRGRPGPGAALDRRARRRRERPGAGRRRDRRDASGPARRRHRRHALPRRGADRDRRPVGRGHDHGRVGAGSRRPGARVWGCSSPP